MPDSALRHRDASGRLTIIDKNDTASERYIRPSDGRLVPLVVQESDEKHPKSGPKSWIRTGKMRLQISPILDLVHWTYSSVFEEGSEERHYGGEATLELLIKWLPSCIVLVLMVCADHWHNKAP